MPSSCKSGKVGSIVASKTNSLVHVMHGYSLCLCDVDLQCLNVKLVSDDISDAIIQVERAHYGISIS